ncbi:uncharacterized protein LOC123546760 [Mercenaria mercenaria]|uniref:uncharacterized protein LOC123546760 n=1 Tax=Mercenaria mercenaria TaxID=6596 RepID=UPI00234E5CB7|nr:uncharacterized protein LOC123546760 [Mercenaria mercenaria]
MCLYCNVSVEDPRDNEVFLPTQNQDSLCSYIAPCRHDELGKQVNSFLKIKALTFNDVHMHAFSNCDTENISADANCTSYPFQTCTENTTSDGRTELCCSTSEIVSIDECENRWFFWIVSGVSVTLYVCGIVMCCLSAEIRRKIILRRMWQRMINETETASYR